MVKTNFYVSIHISLVVSIKVYIWIKYHALVIIYNLTILVVQYKKYNKYNISNIKITNNKYR